MGSSPFDRLRMIIGDGGVANQIRNAKSFPSNDTSTEHPKETSSLSPFVPSDEPASMSASKSTTCDAMASNDASEDDLSPQEKAKPPNQSIRGELGPLREYCPILAVSKFPYKYMDPASKITDNVSKDSFANNRFWDNVWTLYYLHVPPKISVKSLLLVPKAEVELFLSKISKRSGISLECPRESTGFVVPFTGDGSPLPRYLGISTCRNEFSSLEEAIPTARLDFATKSDGSVLPNCDQRTFKEWAEKIERAIDATKNKPKLRARKKQKRIINKIEWSRQLRRAQRYLGLRESASSSESEASEASGASIEGTHKNQSRPSSSCSYVTIDLTRPVSPPFESNVVFVSLDLEVYEYNHKIVTEIGLAVLDTSDLERIPPGNGGRAWMDLVTGRHFLINENSHLVNKDHVAGCPDRYEACFGFTESVSVADAVSILGQCFQDPLMAKKSSQSTAPRNELPSVDSKKNTSSTDDDGSLLLTGKDLLSDKADASTPRKIILVGHGINNDIKFLKTINFDCLANSNVVNVLDTSELYRAMKHEDTASSVSTMLHDLGICGWNLHNAGNDAAYTLQALISIAVLSATGDRAFTDPAELISKAKQDTEYRIREKLTEWQTASNCEDEDDDAPENLLERFKTLKLKQHASNM